jgi:hypothetical protein
VRARVDTCIASFTQQEASLTNRALGLTTELRRFTSSPRHLSIPVGKCHARIDHAEADFGREILAPKEVVQRLAGSLTLISAVQSTQEAHRAAVKACKKAMPTALALSEKSVGVVKAHLGSDSKILATFGMS